jgi:hypothetical protein
MLRVDPERLFLPRSPWQGLRGVEGTSMASRVLAMLDGESAERLIVQD